MLQAGCVAQVREKQERIPKAAKETKGNEIINMDIAVLPASSWVKYRSRGNADCEAWQVWNKTKVNLGKNVTKRWRWPVG